MGYDIERPFNSEKKEFNIDLPGCFCQGMIFKRSQHLKRWESRYIAINPEGLFSYKSPNESSSFSIKAVNAKYIWTRFDIHNQHLVIKIKHGLERTEFGIPINNYCRKSTSNWLFGFYRMIMERNISKELS